MVFDVCEITAGLSLVVMPLWHQSHRPTLLCWIINKYNYKKQQNKSHRLKQNRTPLRFCFASRKIEVSKGFPPCRFSTPSLEVLKPHTHGSLFTTRGSTACHCLSKWEGPTGGGVSTQPNRKGVRCDLRKGEYKPNPQYLPLSRRIPPSPLPQLKHLFFFLQFVIHVKNILEKLSALR